MSDHDTDPEDHIMESDEECYSSPHTSDDEFIDDDQSSGEGGYDVMERFSDSDYECSEQEDIPLPYSSDDDEPDIF